MRRWLVLLVLAALLVGTGIPALAGKGNARNFTAHLSGGEEVPPVETTARGQAIFQVSKDGESIDYKLIVANIDGVTQAHIHVGPRGDNGPVAVFLFGLVAEGVTVNGVLAQGTITADDLIGPLGGATIDDLVDAMVAGNTYVNVHTLQHPGGEIRGQIK